MKDKRTKEIFKKWEEEERANKHGDKPLMKWEKDFLEELKNPEFAKTLLERAKRLHTSEEKLYMKYVLGLTDEDIEDSDAFRGVWLAYLENLMNNPPESIDKNTLKEIKQILKDFNRQPIIDRGSEPLLPNLSKPLSKYKKENGFLIMEEIDRDKHFKIEVRLPADIKEEEIKKFFAQCRPNLYELTIKCARIQKTLSPLIPIEAFNRLGQRTVRNINEYYKSLLYVYCEYERKGKGKDYYYKSELNPIVRTYERFGKGKGSYIRATLDEKNHKSLAKEIYADRKLIGKESDLHNLLNYEQLEEIYKIRSKEGFKVEGSSHRILSDTLIDVNLNKRSIEGAYRIWDKIEPVFINHKKTYGWSLKHILKNYLGISQKEIQVTSSIKLGAEIDETLKTLKEIWGITWNYEGDPYEVFKDTIFEHSSINKEIKCLAQSYKAFHYDKVLGKRFNKQKKEKVSRDVFLRTKICFIRSEDYKKQEELEREKKYDNQVDEKKWDKKPKGVKHISELLNHKTGGSY